jgi:hypothetical protein
MRDKKDNATIDLPGFESVVETDAAVASLATVPEQKRERRPRRASLKQEQISLLEVTDASGLPVWQRDPGLDVTGLPVWQPE